ncbi:class I SAM-dependent methyltransferase [Micromonospora zingiberis]|uniref:Class I SAM-dependent methyltransferase n=1 Tax=Micromonospora zingiberis TaxID=2053011 RepID=A0A4R0GR82_9ACTN|nr:class I SAM-dependent methyltransferase [Micromonospora zingiberis]TCC00335.1 class I SAM-dependent methyltransferase [Micromonospora zingiberis]
MEQQSGGIVAYYTDRYREDLRLRGRPQARLERQRTLEILRESLPVAPARILDVGGGTGEYARALVALGYQVRLLDLVPAHVDRARAGRPGLDAEVADARALPEEDDSYDATLLLGPLYHLPDHTDRCTALTEAVRVTRPGGLVLAAAISRFAGPLDFAATGRLDDRMLEEARVLLTDGRNDPTLGFTHAYFHRVEELVGECHAAGLVDVTVEGIEGPAWIAAEAGAHGPMAEQLFTAALLLARTYGSEPALVAASAHLLARATVPGGPSRTGPTRPGLPV